MAGARPEREFAIGRGGSADDYFESVRRAVARYGSTVAPLLRLGVGQPEASLTFAVEQLLKDVGGALGLGTIVVHREAPHADLGVRPDLVVDVAGARVGVVELKAPGMGVPGNSGWGKARDRHQWEKLKALPNVLYTDGSTWAVYHYGDKAGHAEFVGALPSAGSRLQVESDGFAATLQAFLSWEPTKPRDLRQLIQLTAGLCRLLRDEVGEALVAESKGLMSPLFSDHLADWQEWLFPDLKHDGFVDAYAQTITFGLLLARREGVLFEGLEISDIGERLAKNHLLVGRALSILTARPDRGLSVEQRSIVLQTLRRVVGVADWQGWTTTGSYHQLYEDFLQAYDANMRKRTGAYYTPQPVADFMTRCVDEVLQKQLGVGRGLVDRSVVVLDPAMGTGTFLQSVLDQVALRVEEDRGDVPAALRNLLARLIGFEKQIGPFAVAELKLFQALLSHGAEASDEDFRLYVADTLDDPSKATLPVRGRVYAPLANSRRDANRVKADEKVMVVLGNPPTAPMQGILWTETSDTCHSCVTSRPRGQAGSSTSCTRCQSISGAGLCGRRSSPPLKTRQA